MSFLRRIDVSNRVYCLLIYASHIKLKCCELARILEYAPFGCREYLPDRLTRVYSNSSTNLYLTLPVSRRSMALVMLSAPVCF